MTTLRPYMLDHSTPPSLVHLTTQSLFPPVGVPFHVHSPTHDGDVPLHDHDFFEIAVILGGVGVHRTIHGETAIGAGDVFIIHPGQWHAFERCRGLQQIYCLMGMELLTHELGWTRADAALAPLLPERGSSGSSTQGIISLHLTPNELQGLVDELNALRMLDQRDDALRLRPDIIGRLLLVLGRLSRAHAAEPQARIARHQEVDPHVQRAIALMEEKLDHDWGLVELAQMLELNRSYLVRLFKRHTGHSPMAWLTRRRAEKAAVLLLTTDMPIAAIGREVGWYDPNYFARRFRAAFGQSARAYRQQLPCPALVRQTDDWIKWRA